MNLLKVIFLCTSLILFSAKTDKVNIQLTADSTMARKSKNAYSEFGWGERLRNFINEMLQYTTMPQKINAHLAL